MEKQQIISFIKAQLEQGRISSEELAALAHGFVMTPDPSGKNNAGHIHTPTSVTASVNMINTLYAIGTIIGIVGVSILISQHWAEIGFGGRIGVTLGISFISYLLAILICKSRQVMLSQTLFIIAVVLAPLGTYVLLEKMDMTFSSLSQMLTALSLFVIFAVAQYIARTNILVLILTALGTWAYYTMLTYIFSFSFYDGDLMKWATIVLGFTYVFIALGYSRRTVTTAAVNVLYALGTLAVLAAGISLGGVWDFIYIAFIFAAFYGSVYVRSQAMLIIAAGFLIGHVLKLTYRFFMASLGWPVALIISGVVILLVGYLTVQVGQRYLKKV